MHIFVINLEKDVARRDSISSQLNSLGLSYEIVPAVYGATLSAIERARDYDDTKAKWYRGRSLFPVELGTSLSHAKVYREIVDRGIDYALILEDDVRLPSSLPDFLRECALYLNRNQPSLWLLSPASGIKKSENNITLGMHHCLMSFRAGFYASSYLITGAGASALLREVYPVYDVSDNWKKMIAYRVVDIFVVSPPLISQDQDEFGSSSTENYNEMIRRDIGFRIIYKLRRIRSVLWDMLYAPYRRWFRPYSGIDLPQMK